MTIIHTYEPPPEPIAGVQPMFRWKRVSSAGDGSSCAAAFIDWCGLPTRVCVLHIQNLGSRKRKKVAVLPDGTRKEVPDNYVPAPGETIEEVPTGQDVVRDGPENVRRFLSELYARLGATLPLVVSTDDDHSRAAYTAADHVHKALLNVKYVVSPPTVRYQELRDRYGRKLETAYTGDPVPRVGYGHRRWPTGYGTYSAPVLAPDGWYELITQRLTEVAGVPSRLMPWIAVSHDPDKGDWLADNGAEECGAWLRRERIPHALAFVHPVEDEEVMKKQWEIVRRFAGVPA